MTEKIRIVGISSSPRHANTEVMLKEALKAAEETYPEVQTEFYCLKAKLIKPCCDCKACERRTAESLADQCIQRDDWSKTIRPLVDPVPNGIILASPVYFSDINAQMRAFMERCTSLVKPFWFSDLPFSAPDFSRTAAGGIAVGFHRHGGQETAILSILKFCAIMGMAVVGSVDPDHGPIGYYGGGGWEDVTGSPSRESVKNDAWGLFSARVLGRKVARTALMLAKAPEVLPFSETFVSPMESYSERIPAAGDDSYAR
ncbi:MAG: flavodoxin family protein [Chloroflexi bacterium]|nr:MAG: flavodoxin family protein [Chloroflexota bacterium]